MATDTQRQTTAEMLALPLPERRRIMAAQAAAVAPFYEADLALPPEERELTAFTALEGDEPVLEPSYYMGVTSRTAHGNRAETSGEPVAEGTRHEEAVEAVIGS